MGGVGVGAVRWNTQSPDLDPLNQSSPKRVKGKLNGVWRCEYAAAGGGHAAYAYGPRGPDRPAAHQALKAWWEAQKWRQNLEDATVCSWRSPHAYEPFRLTMTRTPPKTLAQEKRGLRMKQSKDDKWC